MITQQFSATAVIDRHYDRQLQRAYRRKEIYDKRAEIRDIRKQTRVWTFPTTTKILLAYIIGNCTVVEIYSMWVMYALADISALYALIAAVITESITFITYCAKSYNETKQEEIIKLERSKLESAKAKLAEDHSAPDMDETGDPDEDEEKEESEENER